MSWLRRLMGLKPKPDPLLDRADKFAEAMEHGDIEIRVKIRNPRAIAELQRINAQARR